MHPYVWLHGTITLILFSWIQLGIEITRVVAPVLSLVMTFVAMRLKVGAGWGLQWLWENVPSANYRVPVLAAIVVSLSMGIPGFYGILFFINGEDLAAFVCALVVVVEVAICLTIGTGRFISLLNCGMDGMDSEVWTAIRDLMRWAYCALLVAVLVHCYYIYTATCARSAAVEAANLTRANLYHQYRQDIIGDFNAVYAAQNKSLVLNVSNEEMDNFIFSPWRTHILRPVFQRLRDNELEVARFDVWSASISALAGVPVNGTLQGLVDFLRADHVEFQVRMSCLWALLGMIWFIIGKGRGNKPTEVLCVESLWAFCISLAVMTLGSFFWGPFVSRLPDAAKELSGPLVGVASGILVNVLAAGYPQLANLLRGQPH
jgi:hypothetical protein